MRVTPRSRSARLWSDPRVLILLPIAFNAAIAVRMAWAGRGADTLYWTAAALLNVALLLRK